MIRYDCHEVMTTEPNGHPRYYAGMVEHEKGDYVAYTDHTAALAACDAEIAALRADAERLNWLAEESRLSDLMGLVPAWDGDIKTLRAAIDAAMKGE